MKILIVDDIKGWRDYHSYIMNELFENTEIQTAESAREGYDKILENNEIPFDIIITDMQMESDFEPKYAGEWFIEQIKTFKNYKNTKIVIISAAYNIPTIAENYGVDYIRKGTARSFPDAYNFLNE
ncbi:MAG: response regulator [Cyanobacteria bacterium SIG31]|nr:response regulator [Cyanobacteria bacterium SIG31]